MTDRAKKLSFATKVTICIKIGHDKSITEIAKVEYCNRTDSV